MSLVSYSDKDDWAIDKNYTNWNAYTPTHPKEVKLNNDLEAMASIINITIGSYAIISIGDGRDTWLKQLNIEMVDRKYDKQVDRTSHEGRGIYNPHDYLYSLERDKLYNIGIELGYRVFGGTSL